MIIENAQWSRGPVIPNGETPPIVGFLATVDGVKTVVPKDTGNTTYVEAMRQVEAGTLTIADAD
jgi:hypothetical protein